MTAGAPTKIEHLGSADEDAWVGAIPSNMNGARNDREVAPHRDPLPALQMVIDRSPRWLVPVPTDNRFPCLGVVGE
jgi:hypothetical protein